MGLAIGRGLQGAWKEGVVMAMGLAEMVKRAEHVVLETPREADSVERMTGRAHSHMDGKDLRQIKGAVRLVAVEGPCLVLLADVARPATSSLEVAAHPTGQPKLHLRSRPTTAEQGTPE